MPPLKPYRAISIHECGEPLISIPRESFLFFEPHPYTFHGAPYGSASPWMLRKSVLESLLKAQKRLQTFKRHWKIMLFDAYRPNAVQAYMVEHELSSLATKEGLNPANLSPEERGALLDKVLRIWGMPSDDPATPPPHSTGAVIDCTLADEKGQEVDMGSPVDENSDRSYPDYFATATDPAEKQAHMYRQLLYKVMYAEGFRRNPSEWWHFSQGDQLALWIDRDIRPHAHAIYGRADLL